VYSVRGNSRFGDSVSSEREAVRPWQYVDAELTGNAGRVAHYLFFKTAFDILFSLLMSHPMRSVDLLTAFAIRISSPGPILFEQSEWDSTERLQDVQVPNDGRGGFGGERYKWTVPNDPDGQG